jgi:hypothetical protein
VSVWSRVRRYELLNGVLLFAGYRNASVFKLNAFSVVVCFVTGFFRRLFAAFDIRVAIVLLLSLLDVSD